MAVYYHDCITSNALFTIPSWTLILGLIQVNSSGEVAEDYLPFQDMLCDCDLVTLYIEFHATCSCRHLKPSMAEPSWQELLRLRLSERNAKQNAFASIIEQCTLHHSAIKRLR